MTEDVFRSFLMGGFECSTHRIRKGKRLDMIAATRHDEFARADYDRMIAANIRVARDGLRWHLIETVPFQFDFSSLQNQVKAARETDIQIIWDVFHYGYPDHLDIFSPEFPAHFAVFAQTAARFLRSELKGRLFFCPVNEMSFFSWAAGEVGHFYPFAKKRGNELKRQLVRMNIAAIDAIRSVDPEARFVTTEPAIHVVGASANSAGQKAAESYRLAQFQALDMLSGRIETGLGGGEKYLDIIGLNYYFHNQWRYPKRQKIPPGHKDYRPFHQILNEFYERYRRQLFIAETGIEDEMRPGWFRYVCDEVRTAILLEVPVEGICLYPIVNHPGWLDERHCHNGLWDYLDEKNEREVYSPLLKEIETQQIKFARM
jgi:beta-glucosidase/6-phospho-beta-glucosidase/beta-galactosidase